MTTVLCVEDEKDLREYIVEELEDNGLETYEARDGVEGLQMVLRHKPDIVVSDISMPRMSGLELVRQVRQDHPELADMPFIFLTAFTDREDMLEGLESGADDYLTKPVDFEMLRTKVATALRQSQRMIERKQEQQVKLYKALTASVPEQTPEPKQTLPKHKLILVGESNPGLWDVQHALEALGQDVRVFTSGLSFLKKVETLEVDAILLWLHTDDMQGPMIAAMNKSRGQKTIVVLPENMPDGRTPEMNGVHDVVHLPLSNQVLVTKLKRWLPNMAQST